MSLTGLLLISNSEIFTLIAFWLIGAALVVGLFLFNRSRIKHDQEQQ